MFDEKKSEDILIRVKEEAMKAMLPDKLPTEMKQKFLELSHNMTPKQIAYVGERFREAHKQALETYLHNKKWKEQHEGTTV